MPQARLRYKDEPFDSLFKRWKRSCVKDNLIKDFSNREFYEPNSVIKQRKKRIAQKREFQRQQKNS
jgi:ribosomal protein S21